TREPLGIATAPRSALPPLRRESLGSALSVYWVTPGSLCTTAPHLPSLAAAAIARVVVLVTFAHLVRGFVKGPSVSCHALDVNDVPARSVSRHEIEQLDHEVATAHV